MQPLEIEGRRYFRAIEVADEIKISRQTLWRWRADNKIPLGHRFRGRQIVFTAEEFETIREFANRIEPVSSTDIKQLGLFNGSRRDTK
jgi:predicted DNA-binding transcriptional regulator AlpA